MERRRPRRGRWSRFEREGTRRSIAGGASRFTWWVLCSGAGSATYWRYGPSASETLHGDREIKPSGFVPDGNWE